MGNDEELECPKHGTHAEWVDGFDDCERMVCGKCIMDYFIANFPSYDKNGKDLRIPTLSSYADISWNAFGNNIK